MKLQWEAIGKYFALEVMGKEGSLKLIGSKEIEMQEVME